MAQTVSVIIGAEDRARLAAFFGDCNGEIKRRTEAVGIFPSEEAIIPGSGSFDF